MQKPFQTPGLCLKLSKTHQKYLIFQPFTGSMSVRPIFDENSAYKYKFLNSEVKLIRYTLEDNGFSESFDQQNWSIL